MHKGGVLVRQGVQGVSPREGKYELGLALLAFLDFDYFLAMRISLVLSSANLFTGDYDQLTNGLSILCPDYTTGAKHKMAQ